MSFAPFIGYLAYVLGALTESVHWQPLIRAFIL